MILLVRTCFGKVSSQPACFSSFPLPQHLCSGASIVGTLEQAGIGSPLDPPAAHIVQDLARECTEHNQKLISTLEQDENHAKLFELTCKDAEMGRMSKPEPVDYRVYSNYHKVISYLCEYFTCALLSFLCLMYR